MTSRDASLSASVTHAARALAEVARQEPSDRTLTLTAVTARGGVLVAWGVPPGITWGPVARTSTWSAASRALSGACDSAARLSAGEPPNFCKPAK
jgi:hypothetical protein